ncbi:MAG: hypothetical protein AAGA03_03940, partial [Planctomycetota bacterium]
MKGLLFAAVRSGVVRFVLALAVTLSLAPSAQAYTPSDPVVLDMVKKGANYLNSPAANQLFNSGFYGDGERVLVAYAHYKVEHDPDAAVVKRGLSYARKIAKDAAASGEAGHTKVVYAVACAIFLLVEVDPQGYKAEIESLLRSLQSLQLPNGAFTYPGERNGDTSQTQYGLLAYWTADRANFKVDYQRVQAAGGWLLRVQTPDGGWPYHGNDPGPGRPRTPQRKVDVSMTLAGGSSLLIAGDTLGAWGDTRSDQGTDIVGMPEAVKIYREDNAAQRRSRITVPKEPIFRSIDQCYGYLAAHPYTRPKRSDWYYYQLYTLERFESFVEIANGRPKDPSPAWYNAGVEELRPFQDASGRFGGPSYSNVHVNTAFAILFLIRSTQKAIFKVSSGALAGGRGLSDNLAGAKMVGGAVKAKPVAAAVTDLLDLLEDDAASEIDSKALPEDLKLSTDPSERVAQMERLERLLRGSQAWQARRVAARVLGTSDE